MRFPTPADAVAHTHNRDRTIDALRALSLIVVVAGHAVMALPVWTPGRLRLDNTLAHSSVLPALTWLLQVMPLFFFAGGAASAHALRRRPSYSLWVWTRLRRLYKPVIYSTALWFLISVVALRTLPAGIAQPIAKLSVQLLWFLACYTITLLAAPALARAVQRSAVGTVTSLLAGTAAVDVVGHGWIFGVTVPGLTLLNFAIMWCVPFSLGLCYSQVRLSPRPMLLIAAGAFALNVALVACGPYELSLVTIPGQRVSNMSPPTVVLALHAVVLCALATAARTWIERALARPRLTWAVVVINLSAMTIYLWHLPVLILLLAGTHLLGLDRPAVGSLAFIPATLILLPVFALLVAAVVRVVWPSEHAPLPWWDAAEVSGPRLNPTTAAIAAGVGGVTVAVATLLMAKDGLAGLYRDALTMPALIALVIGLLVCRAAALRCAPREPKAGANPDPQSDKELSKV